MTRIDDEIDGDATPAAITTTGHIEVEDDLLARAEAVYPAVSSQRELFRCAFERGIYARERELREDGGASVRCDGCGHQFDRGEAAGTSFDGDEARYRCPECGHATEGPPRGETPPAFPGPARSVSSSSGGGANGRAV